MNNNYEGFDLVSSGKIELFNDECYLYRHNKTKALVFVFGTHSSNKAFNLSFDTPLLDNSGIRHIIEHSVLCGSRKYQTKDPYMDFKKVSVSTYMNALTGMDNTMYPFSTCHEEDFFNLADLYLDSVFYPKMVLDKRIFEGEGYHYEIDDNGSLLLNGVVYNEMKKCMSDKSRVIHDVSFKDIYPESSVSYVSGGDPKYIPNLSYEKFVSYYKKYYHPSNSFLVLYGDFNIERMLKLLNEYYSDFNYKPFSNGIKKASKMPETNEFSRTYPATAGETKDKDHILKITYKLPSDISLYDLTIYDMIFSFISEQQCNPFNERIVNKGLASRIRSCVFWNKTAKSVFSILEEVVEGTEDKVKEEYFDIMNNLSLYIDREKLVHYVKRTIYRVSNSSKANFNLNIIRDIISNYTFLELAYRNLTDDEILNELIYAESGMYSDIKNLVGDSLKSMDDDSIADELIKYIDALKIAPCFIHNYSPDINFARKIAKNEKSRLQAKLKKLTNEDKRKIIINQEALRQYRNRVDSKEALDKIPRLQITSLPDKAKWIKGETKKVAKIPVTYYKAGAKDVTTIRFYFDASGFTMDELRYLRLAIDGFLRVDTRKYQRKKVTELTERYLLVRQTRLKFTEGGDNLMVSIECFNEDINEAMNFMIEAFKSSEYSDKDYIKALMNRIMNGQASHLINDQDHTVREMLLSGYSVVDNKSFQLNGPTYIRFIQETLKKMETLNFDISSKLKRISKKIFSSERLSVTVITTDPKKSKEVLTPKFVILSNAIDRKRNDKNFNMTLVDRSLAFSSNTLVNYIGMRYDLKDYNIGPYQRKVLACILREGYLWDEVRLKGGAYGTSVYCNSNRPYLAMVSYRDPQYENTIDVFSNIAGYLKTYDGDLDLYIMKEYMALENESHLYQVVDKVDDLTRMGITREMYEKRLENLKSLTKEDINLLGESLEHYDEKNYKLVCVASSKDKIKQDEKRFDFVYYA